MATQLEIADAKDRFAELLIRARSGEEIMLAEGGTPVARIGPAGSDERVFEAFKGRVLVAEEFDEPLPPDVLAGFHRLFLRKQHP